jgi:predicted MFS family arabinose efflux permease
VLTAGIYALTFLPALLGSVLLGSLADRFPRRALLVAIDCVRAGLMLLMAVPSFPLWVVAALLVAEVGIGTPWKAAESALVADILLGGRYSLGAGLRIASTQGAQVVGFAFGGLAVATIGPRLALLVDAASFALSAVLIAWHVNSRPSVASDRGAGTRVGVQAIAGNPSLRILLGLAWLAGFLVVPEGLAAPYAAELGGGAGATGLLLAAGPAGTLIGSLAFARLWTESARARAVGPLAVVAGVPLVGCLGGPGLAITMLLWAVMGVCSAYQVQVITEFVGAVAPSVRGQAISVASAGLLVVQGLGLLGGGLLGAATSLHVAIGVAGAASCVLALPLAISRSRHGLASTT